MYKRQGTNRNEASHRKGIAGGGIMKKHRHFIGKSSFHKDFGDIFIRLSERHGRHEVWSDFVTMSACALSNAGDKRFFQEREEMFLAAVKRYTKDEADKMCIRDSFLGEFFK